MPVISYLSLMKTIIILIFSCLLLSVSCKKKKKCSRSYELEHPVSVYPVQDSYNVGDTIWFEMNFSDVFDAVFTNNFTGDKENQSIQLKDFDFHRNILFFLRLNDGTVNLNSQDTDSWQYFTPVLVTGTVIYEHHDGPEYKLDYNNEYYKFKIGVICNQSGRFVCRPGFGHYYSNAEGQYNEQDLTPECETEIITDIRFPVNKQSNGTYLTNYHLFEQFMNPALENDLDRIKKECFTFVVN